MSISTRSPLPLAIPAGVIPSRPYLFTVPKERSGIGLAPASVLSMYVCLCTPQEMKSRFTFVDWFVRPLNRDFDAQKHGGYFGRNDQCGQRHKKEQPSHSSRLSPTKKESLCLI